MAFTELAPPTLVEMLAPEIEAKIQGLHTTEFNQDPIAGRKFSRIVSVMSSGYKRHGSIIERAILEQLGRQPELTVWSDRKFLVAPNALHIANGALKNPSSIDGNEVSYGEGGTCKPLQIDAIVYHKEARTLRGYEIKRGFGSHDSHAKEVHEAQCAMYETAFEILWPIEGPRPRVSQ